MPRNAITKAAPDYEKLLSLLREVSAEATDVLSLDDELSKLDVVDILDGDDETFGLADLDTAAFKRNARLFGDIETILDKWEGLREAPLNLDDSESLLAWLTADGMNLQYVPDDAQSANPEAVLAALMQNPEALRFTSASFQKENPELVNTALESNALALEFTTPAWQIAHPTATLKAVTENTLAAKFLTPEFENHHPKTTLKAFTAAIERNPFTIGLTPPSFQLANPDLVYKAVYTLASKGKEACRIGDSILYHITTALKEFGPVHTLVIAGHGSKTTLQLGPDGSRDEDKVDTGDHDRCNEAEQSYFVPGGNILLWACSNGEGGEEDDNLHRAFAWSYPGVSVTSAPESVNISRLWFDAHKVLHTELDSGVNPVISAPMALTLDPKAY